jgi:hypothetical protein
MLLIISSLIVILYTFIYGVIVYQNKRFINPGTGKCISMTIGMISSLTIGLFFAILLQGRLAESTVLAILLCSLLTFFISRPFGSLVVIEALASGLMGSMMGAMLGEMLPENQIFIMILAMDVIYFFFVFSINMVINKEKVQHKLEIPRTRSANPFLITLLIPLLLVGVAAFFNGNHSESKSEMNSHQHMMMNE